MAITKVGRGGGVPPFFDNGFEALAREKLCTSNEKKTVADSFWRGVVDQSMAVSYRQKKK